MSSEDQSPVVLKKDSDRDWSVYIGKVHVGTYDNEISANCVVRAIEKAIQDAFDAGEKNAYYYMDMGI